MLRYRLPVGAALIALLGALLWLDGRAAGMPAARFPDGTLPAGAVLALASVLVLVPVLVVELTRLLKAGEVRVWPLPFSLLVACSAFASVCLHAWNMRDLAPLATVLVLLGLLPALWALATRNAAGAVASLGCWLLLAVWAGAMPACWIALRAQVPWTAMVGAILAVKCNDIGAYFAGRAFGRHRMVPWISAAKTWEGFAGGAAASIAAGAWVGSQLPVGVWHGVAFGACAAVLGPFGDLSESILKRNAGAKDSGAWLPGMGGALDVFDSLLPTAPAALWLLAARA